MGKVLDWLLHRPRTPDPDAVQAVRNATDALRVENVRAVRAEEVGRRAEAIGRRNGFAQSWADALRGARP